MDKWKYIKENYIDKHIKIFPVEPNGKKPLIENWQNDCSYDYFQVLYWYINCPDCNWGLPCTPNNLFVLDLDVHDENKNGIDNFCEIENILWTEEEYYDIEYMVQTTPSGGQHLIFKTDEDLKNVSNGSNVFAEYPGIDIRTDGYIVVAPSMIDDKKYTFEHHKEPLPIPNKLKKFILDNANLKEDSKGKIYQKPTHVDVGDRDNQLFAYINDLYFKTRLDYDEILILVNHFNETVFDKPFSKKTIEYKVKKAFGKDRGSCIFIKIKEE